MAREAHLPLTDTDERAALREAVRALGNKYGLDYMIDKADNGEYPTELWREAGEISAKSLDLAVQTLGGNGLSTEYGLARMFGASRLPRIAPISREMLLNYVGTNIMGLPKSY